MTIFDKKDFQDGVICLLLRDREFMESHNHLLKSGYFKLSAFKLLAKLGLKFFRKRDRTPKKSELIIEVEEFSKTEQFEGYEVSFRECEKLIKKIWEMDMPDGEWFADHLRPFVKRREAIRFSKDIDRWLKEEGSEGIPSILIDNYVKRTSDIDRDLNEKVSSFEETLEELKEASTKNVIKTPWETMNKHLEGINEGELWAILSKTNAGKSGFLTALGLDALAQGFNVLHLSFEDSKKKVLSRYAAGISKTERKTISDSAEKIIKKLRKILPDYGKLFYNRYPAYSVKASEIPGIVRQAEKDAKVKFDLVILDYAPLLASEDGKKPDHESLETSLRILRDYGIDSRKRLATALQANREGEKVDLITLNHMASSYAMAMVLDVVFSLNQNLDEKEENLMRLFLLKVKDGEGTGEVIPVKVNHGTHSYPETDAMVAPDLGQFKGEKRKSKEKDMDIEDVSL